MGFPVTHREEEKEHVKRLKSEKERQLNPVVSQETVDAPEDKHPDCAHHRVCQEPSHSGPPVVEDVLGEAAAEPVGEEAADNREPDHKEEDEVVEHVERLVAGAEAEAHPHLREEQEEEVLQIPVQQQRSQVQEKAKGLQ